MMMRNVYSLFIVKCVLNFFDENLSSMEKLELFAERLGNCIKYLISVTKTSAVTENSICCKLVAEHFLKFHHNSLRGIVK